MVKIWKQDPNVPYIDGYLANWKELGLPVKHPKGKTYGKLNAKPLVKIDNWELEERNESVHKRLPDFFDLGGDWFVSDDLLACLVNMKCKIESFPAEVQVGSGKNAEQLGNFSLLNIVDVHESIDRENSLLELDSDKRFDGWIEKATKIAFKNETDSIHVLWHEGRFHDVLECCSNALANAILAKRFTGILFLDGNEYEP